VKGFRKDDKALTPQEFKEVMKKIEREHCFGKPVQVNWVKYVRPSFDMRDGKCFYIELDDKSFDSYVCKGRMIDEIYNWLNR
jgi:hypothetical protein